MIIGYIDPGSGFTIVSLGGWFIAFLVGFLSIFTLFFKKIFGFLKRQRKLIFGLLVLLLILIITMIGVKMSKKGSEFNNKIIILGFDGLSPVILEPMMEKGELPNFAKLKNNGSYRRISTTNPSQSPVAWSGFSTGQNPGKNGVFDFIIRDPKTYGLNLSMSNVERGKVSRVIKSKCFWQYASELKVPAVIITCPITFPPDKLYGRMLSGMGVPDVLGTEGTFTFYTSQALEKDKDIGGKVFHVKKAPIMVLDLIGPRVAHTTGTPAHTKIPFKVGYEKGKDSISIEYKNNKFSLKSREWSDWKEVSFRLGLFKSMKGIFKFYLAEVEPDFKLYISPINFDPRAPYFPISYPSGYSKELARQIGLYYTMGMPMDTWAVNEGRLGEKAFLEQVDMVVRDKNKMLDFELSRMQKGILFCYFEDSDIVQHMFWRYIDAEHPLHEKDAPQRYKEIIRLWYKKMDNILGRVMENIGENDTIIVLSDHGFDTFRRAAHLNSWLRRNGYLELNNPDAESGAELLSDINWSKTKAYAIGFGAIYINQESREARGIVRPGKETELLKAEISTKLKDWRDEKYGKPIVSEVYKREDIFWGKYAENTPDLYVGFNTGYRASWQTALGVVPKDLIEDNLKKWSGDHLFDPKLIPGILFSNKRFTEETASIYDITPTVLKIIGYSDEKIKKCGFDGKNLF